MDNVKKKRTKKITVAVLVIVVVIGGIIAVALNRDLIESRLLYMVMPDHIDATVNEDIPLTLYKRLNTDFDPKEDEAIYFMEFYYYDKDGNEVSIPGNGKLIYEGVDNGSPYAYFFIKSIDNINHIKSIAKIVGAVIAVLLAVGLILLWFFLWSKRQDAEKEKKYGGKKTPKSKK